MMYRAASRLLPFAFVSVPVLVAGCTMSPTYDVMGSLFPAWLVCIVLGIVFAVLSRWLLLRLRIALLYPVVAYPCLAAVFTFAIWLIFFQQ
ncbi:MAG TPA: YtcA family lipoprotein [Terracidiphilus sp.]|nr:YtcA family lipoprotein [Terracidiphilus sp.]